MADEKVLKAAKCPECGGVLASSKITIGSGEDEEEVLIAKCKSCGKKFDQHTQVYYEYFAGNFSKDIDTCIFKLGVKGDLDGKTYEIIGHVRYQEEDEYELSVWDEWLAVDSEGTYHWFVEEDGQCFSFEEYVPTSINMEAGAGKVEFEGASISKSTMYAARIVFAEGELSWQPEIGEQVSVIDYRKNGLYFTIEQTDDEVSVTRGIKVPGKKIYQAFRKDDFKKEYEQTVAARKQYKIKSFIYLTLCAAASVLCIRGCVSGTALQDVMSNQKVITENEFVTEEGVSAYQGSVLYGPVNLKRTDLPYLIKIAVNESVQPLSLEWQSVTAMLIKEDKLSKISAAGYKDFFDEMETSWDVVESYLFSADFWDEEGSDSDGHWHESDLTVTKDFFLDDPGRYYIYVVSSSMKTRDMKALTITIKEGIRSWIPYLLAAIVFLGFWFYTKNKAITYSKLPFKLPED